MQNCLASGFPIIIGISVYESFESAAVAQTGIVPMPSTSEKCLGGHALLCVGYDQTKKTFLIRNSWGTDWGMAGYCEIPYDYILNPDLADDFWVLQIVK